MAEDFFGVINRERYVTQVVAGANIKSEIQDQELASEGEKFSAGKLQRKSQVQQNQKIKQPTSFQSFSETSIPRSDGPVETGSSDSFDIQGDA